MKLVSNQLGPNFTLKDSLIALFYTLISRKEINFEQLFCTKNYILASTARTLLQSLAHQIPTGKKIGIPAVSCAVMATPFLHAGHQIEWIDTTPDGLVDINEVKKHIKNLALIIIPHTFGQRADLQTIMTLAKTHQTIVIEDCAHLYQTGEPTAHYRLLSFGREKDISCISGGALTWRTDSPHAKFFTTHYLPKPSRTWTIRHALQPLILSLSLNWWFKGGRYIAGILSKLNIIPRAVTKAEKNGHEDFPRTKLSSTQQHILARAIRQHDTELNHRKKLAEQWEKVIKKKFPKAKITYPENLFRVLVTGIDRKEVLKKSKKIGFDLGEWDGNPIAPAGVDLTKFGYTPAQCPTAEKFINNYVTLPTNRRTTTSDIKRFATSYKE